MMKFSMGILGMAAVVAALGCDRVEDATVQNNVDAAAVSDAEFEAFVNEHGVTTKDMEEANNAVAKEDGFE